MKPLIPVIFLFSLLLSACGAIESAPTTPTISPEDIRATADVMVYDMLTLTQAAMPTNTLVPTNTPLPLPTATITLVPTQSALNGTPTNSVALASPAPIVVPTNTSASSSVYACTEKPLSGWTGDSAQLTVSNYVNKSTANVFLCIVTKFDEAGYINIPVVNTNSADVPMGCYSATAWVDGKKDFNATTTFCINNTSNVQLIIENDRLTFKAGCAPNC